VLPALLLAGLVGAPVATVALLLPLPGAARKVGTWPWTRRLVLALVGTVLLAGLAAAVLAGLGATRTNTLAGALGVVVMSLLWLPVTRPWNARAHLCWSSTVLLFVSYLAFMIDWTFASHLGVGGTIGGTVLWVLEVFAAVLGCAYLWELCDALGREHWLRRVSGEAPVNEPGTESKVPLPFVSLHVPAYNEPPDMVIETLSSLRNLDYERYEIISIDDNTTDEALWRPVEQWCAANGVKFVHLADWPGYKSGALNHALREMTDPAAELIGVIDADYQLEPNFLRRCAPLFADPTVGFIQAPQDYRDWQGAHFYRRLYFSYKYFFAVSQPSRNERDGAIFAGTMGLIRRSAIEGVGGWDEWCITEDAELSLRLLRAGWSGQHVDASFGHGVMPLTFEALKGQRFRWCFGGIQILRRHWRLMLPGGRRRGNQMDLGQRWAYLSGAVQWYGDLLGLLFYGFLLVGAFNITFSGGLLFRKLTGFLVAAIPLMFVLGLVRAVALLRRGTGASWRDAMGAFMIWQSTALVTARASVQALYAKEAEFLRTPKTAEEGHVWDAVRGNRGETVLGLLGLAGIAGALTKTSTLGGSLTAVLLVWPTLAFLAAPINSFAARRAVLPPELAARRRTEILRSPAARVTYAASGVALVAAGAAAVVVLLVPGSDHVVPPQLLGPISGAKPSYGVQPAVSRTSPSRSATPAASPSASSLASQSASPLPVASPSATSSPSAATSVTPTPTATPSSSAAAISNAALGAAARTASPSPNG
jgi:glycosyltransferase involved in cell wall biosynthesis